VVGGACGTNGGEEELYRLLVRKPEGKRLLGRPRHRWPDNTKMDHLDKGLCVVDLIGVAPDRYSWRTFLFRKMLGNYRVAAQLVASRLVLSSTELFFSFVLCTGLDRNQGHVLAYCTSPGWRMVMNVEVIVEWLNEWMNGRGNRSTRRKPAPVLRCPPQIIHWRPGRRVGSRD
jgi:hypothetical protein